MSALANMLHEYYAPFTRFIARMFVYSWSNPIAAEVGYFPQLFSVIFSGSVRILNNFYVFVVVEVFFQTDAEASDSVTESYFGNSLLTWLKQVDGGVLVSHGGSYILIFFCAKITVSVAVSDHL